MTALTQDVDRQEKEGKLLSSPLAASVTVYQGAISMHNAAGFAAPMVPAVGIAFAGIAFEKATNAGAAGDVDCKFEKEGAFLMEGTGFTQGSVGSEVFASDDNTISVTQGTNEVAVGKIVQYISATQVRVKIDGYAV